MISKPINEKTANIVFLVLVFSFSFLIIKGFSLEFSDQNMYIYMGRLISEGKMPYRDFFFSHPPGEIYLDALVFKLLGFKLWAFKLISLIAVLGTAWLLYIIARKQVSSVAGLISAAIFLISYESIRIAAGNVGMALTVFLIVLSLHFALGKRYILSGLSIGLSLLFTLHAALPAFCLFLYSFVSFQDSKASFSLKNAGRFMLGFMVSFGMPNALLLTLAGMQYYSQVIIYHLDKPVSSFPGAKLGLFKLMLQYNWIIFLSAIMAIAMTSIPSAKKAMAETLSPNAKKMMYYILLMTAMYVFYLLFLKVIFPYYFFGMFPFLALLGGIGIYFVMQTKPRMKYVGLLATGLLICLTGIFYFGQYYWTMDNTFSGNELEKLSRDIKVNGSDVSLFGDYLFAPAIALSTGKSITADIVDTNPFRFSAGSIDVDSMVKSLRDAGHVRLVLRKSNGFMLDYNETGEYLEAACKVTRILEYTLPSYFGKNNVKDIAFLLDCKA